MNTKGLCCSHHSDSLVPVERYCRDIHDPWLLGANSHSLVHGEHIDLIPFFFMSIAYPNKLMPLPTLSYNT